MRKYGLIGYPLDHSFSPAFFQTKFQRSGLSDQFSYDAYPIESALLLPDFLNSTELQGFNVTIPYKSKIIPLLDQIDEHADNIKAVNCIKKSENGWIGYNTDYLGFSLALKEVWDLAGIRNALVFGDGGSSKAIQYALSNLNIRFKVISRSGKQNYHTLSPSEIRSTDLLINTTPLGMKPMMDQYPDIPYEAISQKNFCFDLIYNPTETLFLKKSRLLGAHIQNGMRMLQLQAEASWEIWNNT
ncbi:MAG: shikimate dehydrogenase [Salibacteraceae bacterium]